jgi:hypothetical protein
MGRPLLFTLADGRALPRSASEKPAPSDSPANECWHTAPLTHPELTSHRTANLPVKTRNDTTRPGALPTEPISTNNDKTTYRTALILLPVSLVTQRRK